MISPPPKDDEGITEPHDHDEIADDHGVLRGIPDHQMVSDGKGGIRPSSAVLSPSSVKYDKYRGCSVDIEPLVRRTGSDVVEWFRKKKKFQAYIEWAAGTIRAENKNSKCGSDPLKVGYDPLPENSAHGAIWGDLGKPGSRQKRLLEAANQTVLLDDQE